MKQAAAPRLLVVDDEPDLRMLYELTLVREGYEVDSADSVEEAWAALQRQSYAVVITDMRLPDGTGMELLQRVDADGRREKCIVITAYGSAENAVEALKAGAYDYLTKPVDLRQFRSVVAAAFGRAPAPVGESPRAAPRSDASARGSRQAGATPRAAAATAALQRLAGHSVAMQEVRKLIEKVARSMAPVLVHGESGTGKELVARAIHEVSPRAAQAFVAVNCGAIPETLLEAEFFGYRKGAFTGATEDRDGFFQAAHGGTLFLDEIGELPLSMQSKLLRVVQERAVRPLGSTAELPVNVRIVSATHKDLAAEIAASRFRQDLYYRLNVIRITVPPLRERLDDLTEICAAVIERVAGDAGVTPVPELDAAALVQLRRHRFPGNVRELENMLHRALALTGGERIGCEDLELPEGDIDDARDDARDDVRGEAGAAAGLPTARATATDGAPAATPLPGDLAAHLDQVEREVLERALERHRFNRTAAGASLGLSLRQMRYRMARLGIGGEGGAESRSEAE